MIGCRVCDATAHKRTKGAAALAMGKLMDVYGARLVLECAADLCRKHFGLNLWAARYEAAAAELAHDGELHELRREVKRLRRLAARVAKLEKLAA
jgi:hypothetical protein